MINLGVIFFLFIIGGFILFIVFLTPSSSNSLPSPPQESAKTQATATKKRPTDDTTSKKKFHKTVVTPISADVANVQVALNHVYQTDSLSNTKTYYAMKDQDFKINLPVIKILDAANRQVAIMDLKSSANYSRRMDRDKAYILTVKKTQNQILHMELHLNEAIIPSSTNTFTFVEKRQPLSPEAMNAWLRNVKKYQINEIEKEDLAYLGPLWEPTEQKCPRCQCRKYKITVVDTPILIHKQTKFIRNFHTCLACEIIGNEQYIWQASSEKEYNERTMYLSTKTIDDSHAKNNEFLNKTGLASF